MAENAFLILEDGTTFKGVSIGFAGTTVGEVVFNTAMTGYQEIISDPSYASQIVTLTTAHVGNTGTNLEDQESDHIWAAGLIIRDLPLLHSNWRADQSLDTYLKAHHVIGLANIDTRALTKHLREHGAMKGCITSELTENEALEKAKQFEGLSGKDLAKEVTRKKITTWQSGKWHRADGYKNVDADTLPFHVVAYDFGVKHAILRHLVEVGCRVTIVPAQTPANEALKLNPDGIFLSNGPGDPEPCTYAIDAIQHFLKIKIPVFGICLGHQLLALAAGAKTAKMKFGHHGANHPVQCLKTKRVFITSQNHGFSVDEKSLPKTLSATHHSLFDGSLQGIVHNTAPAFGFQGHPEASPGPQDCIALFKQFVALIKAHKADQTTTENTIMEVEI